MNIDFVFISKTGITAILIFLIYLVFVLFLNKNKNLVNYEKLNFSLLYKYLTYIVIIIIIGLLFLMTLRIKNYYIVSTYYKNENKKVTIKDKIWNLSFRSPGGELKRISFFFNPNIRTVDKDAKVKIKVINRHTKQSYEKFIGILPKGHFASISFINFSTKKNDTINILFFFDKYIDKKCPLRLSKIKKNEFKLFVNGKKENFLPNIRIYILRRSRIIQLLYYFYLKNKLFFIGYFFILVIIITYLLLSSKKYVFTKKS